MTMDKIKELFYQFVHKRITTESFEEKIYEYQDLEILLRPDDYLFLISANYKDFEEVENVRLELRLFVITIGQDTFGILTSV